MRVRLATSATTSNTTTKSETTSRRRVTQTLYFNWTEGERESVHRSQFTLFRRDPGAPGERFMANAKHYFCPQINPDYAD